MIRKGACKTDRRCYLCSKSVEWLFLSCHYMGLCSVFLWAWSLFVPARSSWPHISSLCLASQYPFIPVCHTTFGQAAGLTSWCFRSGLLYPKTQLVVNQRGLLGAGAVYDVKIQVGEGCFCLCNWALGFSAVPAGFFYSFQVLDRSVAALTALYKPSVVETNKQKKKILNYSFLGLPVNFLVVKSHRGSL